MTLQQLIYFREVAKMRHFTRAAENLFVAQSSLSHAIQELEAEIGAPLFLRRNGKKIMLTSYGEAFLPYVERALNEINAGRELLQRMVTPNSGTVNIAYTFVNGCTIVPKLLEAFHANGAHSDITIKSLVNHTGLGYIEDRLSMGDAELAVSCATFEGSNQVDCVKIAKQRMYVMLPTTHPLAKRKSVTLYDVKDEPVIMYQGSMHLYSWTVQAYETLGLKPTYVDGFTDWTTQLMEVARGHGIAILPKVDTNPAHTACIPLDHPHNYRDVHLLWPTNRKLSPAATVVKNFCLYYFMNKKHED